MRVAAFVQYCAQNGRKLYQDFIKTIPNAQIVDSVEECDILVIWSVLWKGMMANYKGHYARAVELGKPIVIFEVGMLKRNVTWKVSVNATTLQGLYWPKETWQPDRKLKMLDHIKPVTHGNVVCITGQNPLSENWKTNLSVEKWVIQKVDEVRKYTDRPIEIRPHPRHDLRLPPEYKKLVKFHKFTQLDDTDFTARLQDYWCVINYNSYPGQQARLYGVNAVLDISSLASPVSHVNICDVEKPLDYPNDEWLDFISHTEFTTEEITSGFTYEVLRPLLNR